MMPFTFPMQGLLDAREAQERARRRDVEAGLQARAAQERKIQGLAAEEIRIGQVRRAVLERAARVDELMHAQRYLEALGHRLERERGELARLDAAVLSVRGAFEEARREAEKLRRLRERRRAEWELEAEREERRSWMQQAMRTRPEAV